MDKLTEKQKIDRLQECCTIYRGQLLQAYTHLEAVMDQVILNYFPQSNELKKKEFAAVLVSSLNFNNKANAINFIIHQVAPELKKDSKSQLTKRISAIILERNILAHRIYSPDSKEFPKKAKLTEMLPITLQTMRGGSEGFSPKTLPLNQSKVDEKRKEVYEVGRVLEKLINIIVK